MAAPITNRRRSSYNDLLEDTGSNHAKGSTGSPPNTSPATDTTTRGRRRRMVGSGDGRSISASLRKSSRNGSKDPTAETSGPAPAFRRQRSKSTNQTPQQQRATQVRARRNFGTSHAQGVVGRRMPPSSKSRNKSRINPPGSLLQSRREARQTEREQQEACDKAQAAALDRAWKKRHSDHAIIALDRNEDQNTDLLPAFHKNTNPNIKSTGRMNRRRHTTHTLNPIRILGNEEDDDDSEASFFEDHSEDDDLTIATFVTCEPPETKAVEEANLPVQKTLLKLLEPAQSDKVTTTIRSSSNPHHNTDASTMRRVSSSNDTTARRASKSPSNTSLKSNSRRSSSKHQLSTISATKNTLRQNKSFDEKYGNAAHQMRARVSSPNLLISSSTSPSLRTATKSSALRRCSEDLRAVRHSKKERPSLTAKDTTDNSGQSTRTSLAILKLGHTLDTSQHTETTTASSTLCESNKADSNSCTGETGSDPHPAATTAALKMKQLAYSFHQSTNGIRDI